jgi:hypothetical protein
MPFPLAAGETNLENSFKVSWDSSLHSINLRLTAHNVSRLALGFLRRVRPRFLNVDVHGSCERLRTSRASRLFAGGE